MTKTTTTNIETGIINKNNWTGEEANVQGTFHADGEASENARITFQLDGQDWQLVFQTWEQLDGPRGDDWTEQDETEIFHLIGGGGWVLADGSGEVRDRGQVWIDGENYGKGILIEAGKQNCRTPQEVLASAARWIWNYV